MIENLVRSLLRTRHQDLNTLELVVSVVTLLVVLVLAGVGVGVAVAMDAFKSKCNNTP